MELAGMKCKIDAQGRLLIPSKLRQNLDMKEDSYVEIFITREGDMIVKKIKNEEE